MTDRAHIFCEAGPERGLGHFVRCAALADALAQEGLPATLVVRGTTELPSAVLGGREVEYAEWLDPGALDRLDANTVAVIDSYEAQLDVYEAAARGAGACIWFDDNARLAYPTGLLLNGGPAAATFGYPHVPGSMLLLGPRYQPLRPEFAPADNAESVASDGVLVILGGTDVRDLGGAIVAELQRSAPGLRVELASRATAAELAAAMRRARVAISACGQTLFELAACGVPTIGIIVAENQRANAQGWEALGSLRVAGEWAQEGIAASAVSAALALLGDAATLESMGAAGHAAVDGLGAARVARRVRGALEVARADMADATADDAPGLLELANLPSVREASFVSHEIAPAEHAEWLARKLVDPDAFIFTFRAADTLLGIVRFDLEDGRALVGISLADECRGRGLGVPMLERAIAELARRRPDVAELVAWVKPGNTASQGLFSAAGFARAEVSDSDRVRFVRALSPAQAG